MILRPVRPQSACGPPSSKVPVGLTRTSRPLVVEVRREQRVDHVLDQIGLDQRLGIEARLMLGRDQHGAQRTRHAVLVVDGDLRLPVGPQVREDPRLADLREAVREAVRQPDRQRHEVVGLVARVAEHHPLVTGALAVEEVLAGGADAGLEGGVDALRDVGRLRVDRGHHTAGVAVEADGLAVVADRLDRLADDGRDLDVGVGRDLAGHDGETGGHHGLAGHAGGRVLGQDGVEDRVRDLVGHLVGMALGHGFGREGPLAGHGLVSLAGVC